MLDLQMATEYMDMAIPIMQSLPRGTMAARSDRLTRTH